MEAQKYYILTIVVILGIILLNNVYSVTYDLCLAMSDEKVSYDDFSALIEAIYNEQCNEALNVKTTFSMSKEDFGELAETYEILDINGDPLVFYRSGTPSSIGAGAILVYGNDGDFPVKIGDKLHIWTSGRPKDIIIEVGIEGCDPYDDDCDEICSYEVNNVCDPMCYADGVRDNVQCDIDCVDQNGNGVVDQADFDGICDPDCYNNDHDPQRAYDPDCVVGNDGICDPDSHAVSDGVCDSDCAPENKICDMDCNSTIDAALYDKDCYECDKTCNGFCSPDCSFLDNDPDCRGGFIDGYTRDECCGNDECGNGEDCENCIADCVPSSSGLVEDEPCECSVECDGTPNLVCDGPIGNKHCCPTGEAWNGTDCMFVDYFDIVFVPMGWGTGIGDRYEFIAIANEALDDFMKKSPFQYCPNPDAKVKAHYIDVADCHESCTDHCTDCISKAKICVFNSGFESDKFVAITKGIGGSVGGCAEGIPGDGASVSSLWPGVTAHELGHTLGLYHVNVCGAPNQATDCSCACTPAGLPGGCLPAGACILPNINDCYEDDRYEFVMDYCPPMDRFGPYAEQHLRSSAALGTWLEGC